MIQDILFVLMVVFLGYAVYRETKRRKAAELEADILRRRVELDALRKKLAEDNLDARIDALGPVPLVLDPIVHTGGPEGTDGDDPGPKEEDSRPGELREDVLGSGQDVPKQG